MKSPLLKTDNVEDLARILAQPAPDHMLTVESGPPLPPGFEKTSGKHPFFFRQFKWDRSPVADRPTEQLPGVYSTMPAFMEFMTGMATDGPNVLPVDLDEGGFVGPTGIHKPVGSFGTISGLRQSPMAYPLLDNARLRDTMGLPNEWRNETDRQIFKNVCRIVFSHWKDVPIRTNNRSKSGPPHMLYQANEKVVLIERTLEERNLNQLFKKLIAGKLRDVRKDHGVILAPVVGHRSQTDDVGKVREAADFEYAISGGERGKRVTTNKEVFLHGKAWPKLVRSRMRPVIGYSAIANSIKQHMCAGHLHALYERFPLSLKVSDLQKSINDICQIFANQDEDIDILAGDASTFDATACAEFKFRDFLDVLREYWYEGFVELTELMHRAPYCAPPLSVDGEFKWTGNPDNPEDYIGRGSLKSGSAWVVLIGIIEMVHDIMVISNYAFGGVLGNEERFLRGEGPVIPIDKGDDHLVIGPRSAVAKYREYATAKDEKGRVRYSYMSVDDEAGKQMIGKIIQRLGPREFKVMPRIHSLHEKSLQNEHSINTVFRPAWAAGAFDRKTLYGDNPAYRTYLELRDFHWRKAGLEAEFGLIQSIEDIAVDSMQGLWRLTKTVADLQALIQPSKIDYFYAEGEVSEEIMNMFKRPLKHELTRATVDRYYGGTIIENPNLRIYR